MSNTIRVVKNFPPKKPTFEGIVVWSIEHAPQKEKYGIQQVNFPKQQIASMRLCIINFKNFGQGKIHKKFIENTLDRFRVNNCRNISTTHSSYHILVFCNSKRHGILLALLWNKTFKFVNVFFLYIFFKFLFFERNEMGILLLLVFLHRTHFGSIYGWPSDCPKKKCQKLRFRQLCFQYGLRNVRRSLYINERKRKKGLLDCRNSHRFGTHYLQKKIKSIKIEWMNESRGYISFVM